jgi:ATP-dependent DNA ligase
MEPKLLAEIEHRTKSAEGKLRHSFFRGLREDLDGRLRSLPAWAKKPLDSALIVPQAMVVVSKGTSS